MHRRTLLTLLTSIGLVRTTSAATGAPAAPPAGAIEPLRLSDAQWKQRLTPAQYRVLRQEGTEPPGSSPLDREKRAGIFHCAGCDLPLFSSDAKYDSGTGWPSFWKPLDNAVATRADWGILGRRTEVHCRRCGGHLGHVFNDGPKPTGKRYCMNGLALTFRPA
ncbi:MAG: peptide-methionine (R)-S-oxide reductase MsrB [Rhodoferax sp.]|nr:peptide-methionine (R)-S-oxide reductase MsrB [Rhodoferax sp.]